MREITNLMDHYRLIARSIWNTGFWPKPEFQNWDSWDRFEHLKRVLFDSLIVSALMGDKCCINLGAQRERPYMVVPLAPGPVPIMIQQPRKGDRNRYWDDPVTEVKPGDVELLFLDYFDWNEMGYLDFQYYRVRILSFPDQPHLVGREALLEHQHAGVYVADAAEQVAQQVTKMGKG